MALGFSGLMAGPVIMASVQESVPQYRALANGVYMALSFGIRSVVVVLVGAAADWLGMRWSFLACALLTLAGTPFVAGMPGGNGRAAPGSVAVTRSAEGGSVYSAPTQDGTRAPGSPSGSGM